MKKLKPMLFRATAIVLLLLAFMNLKAQNPNFLLSMRNDVQTSDRILEFDIYLLHTDLAPATMELATVQCGIAINSGILNGGTITPSIVAGSSGLPPAQAPSSISVATTGGVYQVRIAPRTPPGAGNGFIVSQTDPGTRVCRVRLTNSVAFASVAHNMVFTVAAPGYLTRVAAYVAGVNTQLICTLTNCTNSYLTNAILNAPPTAYNVTGSGSYCQGGTGLTVTLSGSQTGVNYQLKKDGSNQGSAVAGTGAALTWDNQTVGTYTIEATNAVTNITNTMTGSAVITETTPVAVSVTNAVDLNDVCAGTSVTFTATPTNGGATPSYQWYKNGSMVGSDQSTYTVTPANGDQIYVVLTSSETCTSGNPATSNTVTMVVNTPLAVSVAIGVDQNNVCAGTSVTFTATPTNGGTPTYQWKVNGSNAGTGLSTYSYVPVNGDQVTCEMTSSLTCVTGSPATSNTITMVVNAPVAVSVSISADQNNVCAGTSVTYTATPTNGGTPTYQWKVNGSNVGTDLSTYSYIPVNGDQVTCEMTSSLTCITGSPATSNTVTMTVNAPVAASVSIVADANPVTAGTSVTFTATPTNGGTPAYQWKVNGSNVGTDLSTYSYIPVNGDQVTCEMTSSLTCVTGSPATSNTVTMTVTPAGSAVTFNVDMTGVGIFNPATDEIFISGSMAGWPMPGSNLSYKMNPVSVGSSIYTITLTVADGECQYKYFRVIGGAASWSNGEWDGDPNRIVNVSGATTLNDVWAVHNTTWTGAISNDWHNAGNWTNNIPAAVSNVTIPNLSTDILSFYPTLSANGNCNNITIESGASLMDNSYLTVSGTATVKQDITGSAGSSNTNWHLMGIPVQSVLSNVFWNCWLKEWLEPAGTYNNIAINTTLNTPMKGYAVRYTEPATTTLSFTGTLNTGTLSIPLTSAGGAYDGWNLVSNPYPSAIDWSLVSIPAGMNSAIYYWEPISQSYVSWVGGVGAGSRYAPAMQGFFVNATSPIALQFTNSVRTHSTASYYKEEVANLLKLTTSANNGTDQTFVRFDANATSGFDGSYDAYKLFSDASEVPQIYSTTYNDKLSINTLPSIETNEIIPVAFRAGVSGDYTINASGMESFDSNTPIWLEDKVLNTAVDFRTNTSYTFSYVTGSDDNRFLLHFKSAYGINDPIHLNINVYAGEQTIFVKIGKTGLNGDIVVYNTLGQEVARKAIAGKQLNAIHMSEVNTVYVVKVVTSNNVCTEKVFVR